MTYPGGPRVESRPLPAPGRRPRVAFLAYWTTEFDSRLERMARAAIDAGYEVIVYGRLQAGLAPVEERAGYRLVRVRAVPRAARVLGPGSPRPASATGPRRAEDGADTKAGGPPDPDGAPLGGGPPRGQLRTGLRAAVRRRVSGGPLEAPYGGARRAWHRVRRWRHPRDRLGDRRLAPRRWTWFLESISGWARALDQVAEPADVWHALGIGGLPAAVRQRDRLGGRAVYDSRDVFLLARSMVTASAPRRALHAAYERRLARHCDAILTVNDAAADLLVRGLGAGRPTVVMNVPSRTAVGTSSDDRIRMALGLAPDVRVVLYQGALLTDRGMEQGMAAILDVPDAALVLLGYGELTESIRGWIATPPYAGRVFLLPAVPPDELLAWTAAADVMLIAIQGTTPNHRIATPNKLFEAMAVGIPVVVADLPGMTAIVRRLGCGVVVDSADPASIAAGIRGLLDLSPAQRHAMGARGAAAVASDLAWETQADRLLAVYAALIGERPEGRP